MTFFYDLNKRLNGIRELPATTNKQLNESAAKKPDANKDGIPDYAQDGKGAKDLAKGSGKQKPDYQSKLQDKFGGSASDLTKGLSIKSKKVDEAGMSRAAKGIEKYGKDGMQALAKAGREGKALDPIRNKYDKYDESVEENIHSQDAMKLNPDFAKVGRKPGVMGKIAKGVKKVADFVAPGDEDLMRDLERKTGGRRPTKEAAAPIDFDKVLDAIAALYGDDIWENDAMQDLANDLEQAGPTDRELDFIIAKGKLPKRLANTQFSAGDNVRFGEAAAPMSAKQKSFAALAEPKDKITFADKIAGAKKEVDEMLGDVAAEAMKAALGKQQVRGMGEATKEIPGGRRHTAEPGGYGRKDDEDAPRVQTQRGRGRPKKNADSETGQVMKPDFSAFGVGKVNLPKHKGKVTKHKMVGESPDQQQVQQIYNDLAEIRAAAKQAQRGGQFPQGFASQLESVLWSAMTLIQNQQPGDAQVREGADPKTWTTIEDVEFIEDLMDRAFEAGSNSLGNTLQGVLEVIKYNQDEDEPVNEKAVSKKQQRFMGMVHAAKKGAKPASKEVAKAAKGISAKEADKFASTKHKGLPEKVKAKDSDKKPAKNAKEEKVDETTTSGSVATAPAAGGKKSGGNNFGKGIYDSYNRKVESMISEGMNISINLNSNDPTSKSITVTATEQDADTLASLLKMAGLGGGGSSEYSNDTVEEAYGDTDATKNDPDYPTNQEYSDDAFQYSGGLNKPKHDVAGNGQATGGVTAVSTVDTDEEDNLSEGSDSGMADRVRDLVGDFDRNMTQMRVYGDPDVERAIAYLKQGDAEAAVEAVVDTYGTQDGGEFRNMSDYAKDLLSDFEYLISSGSGQDDIARMMEMAGVKKKPVDEEKTEEGNKFTGNLAKARAAGKKEADLDGDGKMEKVDESIFDMTRNLWKSYKA